MNKKTMLAISALCATVAFQAKAIESDVVGYNTTTFDESGWLMNIGVAFSNVASQDGSFVLDDNFFSGTSAEGDVLYSLNADEWDLNQYDKLGEGEGWALTLPGGIQEIVESVVLSKGDLIYYFPAEATEVSVAGKVANPGEAQSVTFDLENEAGQWLFPLVNPFPVDTTWGDLGTFTTEGDVIYTLNADEWDLNQYDKLGEGEGWALTLPGGIQEIVNDDEAVIIPAGGAVYYFPTQTTTWTVTL